MRKIKEGLRLRFELGLGQRAVARACSISQSTVHTGVYSVVCSQFRFVRLHPFSETEGAHS
jgi:hypothetical protein